MSSSSSSARGGGNDVEMKDKRNNNKDDDEAEADDSSDESLPDLSASASSFKGAAPPSLDDDDGDDDAIAAQYAKADENTYELAQKVGKEDLKMAKGNRRAHIAALRKVREEQNTVLAKDESTNSMRRLAFLERQAEVFAQFKPTVGGSSSSSSDDSSSSNKKSKKKGGDGDRTRKSEEEEDKELMEDEISGQRLTRLVKQPSCIAFGQMRAYQIEGLVGCCCCCCVVYCCLLIAHQQNWMINLYEQGINGILADEMGLGKTLQVCCSCYYSFIVYAHTHNTHRASLFLATSCSIVV